MEIINVSKRQARIAMLIFFILGFVAGGLALNLYRVYSAARFPHTRVDWFQQMTDRLNLNEDQKRKVEQILSDTRAQIREIHKASQPKLIEVRNQTHERLRSVLTQEQWRQFEEMMAKVKQHRRERKMAGPYAP